MYYFDEPSNFTTIRGVSPSPGDLAGCRQDGNQFGVPFGVPSTTTTTTVTSPPPPWPHLFTENEVSEAHEESNKRDVGMVVKMEPTQQDENGSPSLVIPSGGAGVYGADLLSGDMKVEGLCSFAGSLSSELFNAAGFERDLHVFNLGGGESLFAVGSDPLMNGGSSSSAAASCNNQSITTPLELRSLFEESLPRVEGLGLSCFGDGGRVMIGDGGRVMIGGVNDDSGMMLFGRGVQGQGGDLTIGGLLDDERGGDPFVGIPSSLCSGVMLDSGAVVEEAGAHAIEVYQVFDAEGGKQDGSSSSPESDKVYSPSPPPKRKCYRRKLRRRVSTSKKKKSTARKKAASTEVVSTKKKKEPRKRRSEGSSEGKQQPSSFRVEMGPHLRTVSAVLEVSGMKHGIVPHELLKRFKPVDIFRTILKSTTKDSPGKSNSPSDDDTYDWGEWNCEPFSFEYDPLTKSNDHDYSSSGVNNNDGDDDVIYYSTRAKEKYGQVEQLVSVFSKYEVDGKAGFSVQELGSVGSANLNVLLDLDQLAKSCTNSEFSKDHHGRPLLIRLREPKCTGLVFPTGKLIVVGAKDYEDFRVAARKFGRMVQKAGNDVSLSQLEIHFHLGLCRLPFGVDLGAIVRDFGEGGEVVKWDFEVFPGVIMLVKSVLCLVFESGAVMFTNAPKREDLKKTLDLIYPCLRSFGCTC